MVFISAFVIERKSVYAWEETSSILGGGTGPEKNFSGMGPATLVWRLILALGGTFFALGVKAVIRTARPRNAPHGAGRGLGNDSKKWVGLDQEVRRYQQLPAEICAENLVPVDFFCRV